MGTNRATVDFCQGGKAMKIVITNDEGDRVLRKHSVDADVAEGLVKLLNNDVPPFFVDYSAAEAILDDLVTACRAEMRDEEWRAPE